MRFTKIDSRIALSLFCTLALAMAAAPAVAFESKLPMLHLNTGGRAIEKEDDVEATVSILSGDKNSSADLLKKAPELAGTLKIRGYSSAKWAKHQYALQLHAAGDPKKDNDVALLGLPAHHNWVLAAPYSDRSLIRNAFAFELARGLSTEEHPFWASHTRPIELFLNGQYQGVYFLTEKPDHSKNRMNLGKPDLENPEASPFMVKIEHSKGVKPEEFFTTSQNSMVLYEEPKAKKIAKDMEKNPAQTKRLVANIQNVINRFEQNLLAVNEGKFSGYRRMIDADSFINFILVQEVIKNLDGFRRSMNVHYKDGLLHMGPVWDFDLTLGNIIVFGEMNPEGFQSGHGWYIDGNPELFWFQTMMKDPAFKRALVQRYRSLRKSGEALSNGRLFGYINRLTGTLGAAADRNFTVWNPNMLPSDGPLYLFVPKYSSFRYPYAVTDLKNFLYRRLEWLDQNIDQIGDAPFAFPNNSTSLRDGSSCSFREEGAQAAAPLCLANFVQ